MSSLSSDLFPFCAVAESWAQCGPKMTVVEDGYPESMKALDFSFFSFIFLEFYCLKLKDKKYPKHVNFSMKLTRVNEITSICK